MNLLLQFRNYKIYLMLFVDAVIFFLALVAAYFVRFEFSLTPVHIHQIQTILVWFIPLKLVVFISLGHYQSIWRYTSIKDLWILAQASLISTSFIMAIILVINRFEGYSRAVFVADGVLSFLLIGAKRIIIRSILEIFGERKSFVGSQQQEQSKKVLIIGAGNAGEAIAREIIGSSKLYYKLVGFIDDDERKRGESIHGIKVLGNVEEIGKIIAIKGVEEILIAVPSARGDQIRRIVDACQTYNISYKILPGIADLIDGRASVKFMRDISYEDLLSRLPVRLDIKGIRSYLDGKTILITGCGGSIGSELCRQVLKYQPRNIILLDANETNLFNIEMEIQNEKYCRHCEAVLGQVQDEILMNDVFEKYKPEVVFHAAAYKHVPMLEKNPWQAVFNNIVGSRVAMEIAIKHHVERFVLVSTDKAVRPTNVMGASKRVTELIMQEMQGNGTKLMAVRFGNVLGSSGSVIPIFHRQIERGGPVTVTHPEIKRFFMTIPEASQMILQAGMMGEGGEIFILKMGTPVKIADMARDLIRLSGKEPEVDIRIVYIGLREGEKLNEELVTEGEDVLSTQHEEILALRSNNHLKHNSKHQKERNILKEQIDNLVKDALRHDARAVKKGLRGIVPEYTPYENEPIL
jgi:FlaA1/EpsC-like NDP-sugar epimerase